MLFLGVAQDRLDALVLLLAKHDAASLPRTPRTSEEIDADQDHDANSGNDDAQGRGGNRFHGTDSSS